MVPDAIAAVADRPGGRTRLERACVYLGLVGALLGSWIADSSGVLAGLAVAIPGAAVWTYGSFAR